MSEAPTTERSTSNVQIPASKHSPLRKTIGDILRSMALVGAVVLALVLIVRQPNPDPVKEVDPYPVAQGAAEVADYQVLVPPPTEGWRATSARFEPTEESADLPVWFNGWVSPDNTYFAVIQSAATHGSFIDEQTGDGLPVEFGDATGTAGSDAKSGADGQAWVSYVSEDGNSLSLVRSSEAGTTIVTTSADWEQLRAFADGLVPAQQVDLVKTLPESSTTG